MARAFSPGGPRFPLGGGADLCTISSSQFNFRRRGRGGRRDLQVCKVSSPSRDPFCTLGLAPGASEQDIKRAYRRLALQYHPDVCQGDLCAGKFMQIKEAYQLLMDGGVSTPYYYSEGFMGVNDDTWEDWEEWMGWEGAGTRDYTSHINYAL